MIFNKYNDENNFIFLDPPYPETIDPYNKLNFTNEDHIRLNKCFKNTKCKCLMIINKHPLIEELYKDYIKNEYENKYLLFNKKNTHLIIKNY